MMQTYSDEYIEYWAEVYLQNEISKKFIYFEAFLQDPESILYAVQSTDALLAAVDELDTLLPGHEDVDEAEAMQEEMESAYERQGHVLEMQGDKTIEKFHHHDPAKKWKTNTGNKSRRAS